MSRADLEVARRMYEALESRDMEGFLADCIDPAVVWETGSAFPDLSPVYHGHEGVRRWFQAMIVDAWDELALEQLDLRDEGDGRVVGSYRARGRGRTSGIEGEMRVVETLTVRDGKVVHRTIEPGRGRLV